MRKFIEITSDVETFEDDKLLQTYFQIDLITFKESTIGC